MCAILPNSYTLVRSRLTNSTQDVLEKTIAALLPDSGDRYYSTPLFTE